MEGVERKINKHLRRWLGIPPSFTSVSLYIRSGQQQLPLSSHVEEFRVAKCTFRNSRDNKVREAGVKTRSGRKREASTGLAQAEGNLKLKDIIAATLSGRQSLGMTHFQNWGKANPRERTTMVQAEIRNPEEEQRKARAVELGSQVAWTWGDLLKRKLT